MAEQVASNNNHIPTLKFPVFRCTIRLLGQINNVLLILALTAAMAVITAALTYFIDVLSLAGREMMANPFDFVGQQQTAVAEQQD